MDKSQRGNKPTGRECANRALLGLVHFYRSSRVVENDCYNTVTASPATHTARIAVDQHFSLL
jgi:hypothetical protein